MPEPQLKILVVEDDPQQARFLEYVFEEMCDPPPIVAHVDRLSKVATALSNDTIDLVLLDLTLPDSVGLETVTRLFDQTIGIPVVVLSGYEDPKLERDCILRGAQDFIVKGSVEPRVMNRIIRHAMDRYRLQTAVDNHLQELASLNAQLRSLIADNADAMIVTDEEGIVRFANPAAEDLFGAKSRDLMDAPICIPLGAGPQLEMEISRPDGRRVYADIRVIPTQWEGKRALLATLRDVSRSKRAEQELRDAAESAEEASRMKSAFLANMSHELRTPLNSIIGFSEMIKSESFGPLGHSKYGEYARIVCRSGNHLLELINDLLDLSKAEAEVIELHETEFELYTLVTECVAFVAPDAERSGLCIFSDVQSVRFVGDEMRLKQVVLNLLTNAIKFTPPGGEVRIAACISDSGSVRMDVRDTGIGIPAADLPHIFGKFVQVNQDYVTQQGGAGLGLALCKSFIELHGGTIDVESEQGSGTAIQITLPRERIPEAELVLLTHPEMDRRRSLRA